MTLDPFADFPPGFPRPDYDAPTLERIAERVELLKKQCPRHPEAHAACTFFKPLLVSDPDRPDTVHMPTMAVYADGCMANWRLDVEEETGPAYKQAPAGSY